MIRRTIPKLEISDLVPEKDKMNPDYLMAVADYHINNYREQKTDLETTYNYYNGILDKERYKYLENNYGIGNPASIEFVPLIRKHVDALIGELLREPIDPRITCSNREALDFIENEKKIQILDQYIELITKQFKENMESLKHGKKAKELLTVEQLAKIGKDIETTWKSSLEISAQYLLEYFKQSRDLGLRDKLKTMFFDLLVSGSCYYRVYVAHLGEDPILEVVNPLDIFYSKNTNKTFLRECSSVVHRTYLTRQEILNRYGHQMTEEEKLLLFGNEIAVTSGVARFTVNKTSREGSYLVSNLGTTVDDFRPGYLGDNEYIEVNHVEFMANNKVILESPDEGTVKSKTKNNKERYRLDRYEVTKIGAYYYVNMGKSNYITRPLDKPYMAYLSYNGISVTDRNGFPFSLVTSLMHLQDKFNLLHFYRDNMIANANIPGPIIDVAAMPTFLGKSASERLLKWQGYAKNGLYLINSAQQGQSHINTIYGGMQATMDAEALAAINGTIQLIEQTASSITGVFRERLGGIEQKDAVTNVKVGIDQSYIVTKPLFILMDEIKRELLTDLLNIGKTTYKKGKKGSILLGGMQKIFQIEPTSFQLADYDVHIVESGELLKEMSTIEAITMELVKAQSVDIDVVLTILGSKSLTEVKNKLSDKLKEDKNNNIKQLIQQAEQLEAELKKAQSELNSIDNSKVANDKARLDLDRQRLEMEHKSKTRELELKERIENQKINEISKRTEIEKLEALYSKTATEVENLDI